MNDKLKKLIYITLGGFGILFLFLFLISSCSKRITPDKLESTIINNTKKYFSIHKDELPDINSVMTLSLNDLVNKGIIKDLDKLLEKNASCSGQLIIENNNNYYMYSPNLNCSYNGDEYKTNNLKETILKDIVTVGNGLHALGDSYYYRGDNVNNYIIFDGILWRITKINNDNTIRLIEAGRRTSVEWDNRYNSDRLSNSGINNYTNNGINSIMKDLLDNIYNSETVLSNNAKGFIKPTNLCIGKRTTEETINDGSVECSTVLENQYLGLIQINEYLLASLDPNCTKALAYECSNYNYLANFNNPYWSITANIENNYQVYKISNTISLTNASTSAMARLVINISENTTVTGSGTENDPFVVSGFTNELKKIN